MEEPLPKFPVDAARRYFSRVVGTSAQGDLSFQELMLKAHAESAGAAMACTYASSSEFDAALIAERRAAGVYGPRRHRRRHLATAAAIAAALVIMIYLIV